MKEKLNKNHCFYYLEKIKKVNYVNLYAMSSFSPQTTKVEQGNGKLHTYVVWTYTAPIDCYLIKTLH